MAEIPNNKDRYYDVGMPWIGDPRDPSIPDIDQIVPEWARDIESAKNADSPNDDLKAARYSDTVGFIPLFDADQDSWRPVCQFVVGPGEFGAIFGIETQVSSLQGSNVIEFYSADNPYKHVLNGITTEGLAPRWALVNTPFRERHRPAKYSNFENFPQPLTNGIDPWWDGRFAPNHVNDRTKINVPENTVAVLWIGIPANAEDIIAAYGRLIGYRQSWTKNECAVKNARRMF